MSYVGKITDTAGNTGLVGSTLYGTCSTAADTAAKVVTCSDFDKLLTGVTIHVKFNNTNTASAPTLNVNSTGVKNIYRYGTTAPGTTEATSWQAGSVVSFTYDGTYWQMNDQLNDVNVTQTPSTTDADYEILLSGTADNTEHTEGVNKSQYALFNPSKKAFTFGERAANSTVGEYSFAEGYQTTASGRYSHADGSGTTADHRSQHVFGEWNIADPSTSANIRRGHYVEIVGNGGSSSNLSNARTLDWDGNQYIAGIQTDANGVQSVRDITMSDYESLTTSEKENGVIYNIYDDDGTYGDSSIFEIGEIYDNTATYAVGDYCIYDFRLYKCTTAVSTAEDFDSTKWTSVKTMNELTSLRTTVTAHASVISEHTSAISSLNSNKANTIKFKNSTNIPASDFTSGMYLNNYLNLDSGYSVLCYLYVISNGWVLNSPYYITNNGRLWGATAPSGNLQVYYLEIKN